MKILVIFFFLLPLPAFAQAYLGQPYEIRANGSVLRGHRYLRPNKTANPGRTILLIAGSLMNEYALSAYVGLLYQAGYDVFSFNLPGQGNGSEASFIESREPGYAEFSHLVQIDFPTIVNRIRRITGNRPIVIGHSLGAMVAVASDARGYTEGDLESIIAAEYVPLNPYNADANRLTVENFRTAANGLSFAASFVDNPAVTGLFELYVRSLPWKYFTIGYLDGNNFEWGEITTLAQRAITRQVEPATLYSLVTFGASELAPSEKSRVPVLYVHGTIDAVASLQSLAMAARERGSRSGYWLLQFTGGHGDPLGSHLAAKIFPHLIRFIDDPGQLGPSESRIVIN